MEPIPINQLSCNPQVLTRKMLKGEKAEQQKDELMNVLLPLHFKFTGWGQGQDLLLYCSRKCSYLQGGCAVPCLRNKWIQIQILWQVKLFFYVHFICVHHPFISCSLNVGFKFSDWLAKNEKVGSL